MPSPPADDYYALLGVHPDADDEALRQAWRQLASRWHPDRAGEDATATFQQLSAAYEVLSDPIARVAYDRRRRASGPAAPRPAPAASPPPRASRPPAPGIMLERLCGPLASLLACGVARFDEPGFITLMLRDAEAAQGGMVTISMPVELRCPDCAAPKPSAGCPRCGGRRTVEELFSAWLAVPPGIAAGEVLAPTVELPGMIEPVRFRVQRFGAT